MAGKLNLGKVRGTTIYTGTEITGVDANGKTFPESGITKAYEEDLYVNTDVNSESQGNVYICLTGGDADTAVWAYNGNLRGPQCEVINNLESSRTDAALTAYQGRILKDMMYDSGLITKEVEIDYSGNVQGIKVTTENRATTITVQTASGNITQEKAAGAETTTVSAVPAKQILKVSSSDAYIRKIELYDASNNLVYTDNISSWGAIEDIRQQMEESGTVVDGDDTLATGILAKVKNGVKKVFYPIGHAKAIWYSIKEKKTVYDVIAGLLTKTTELSETTTALTENLDKKPKFLSQYFHDAWVTVKFENDQNALIIGHVISSGNADDYFFYIACAASSESGTPKNYKIAGTADILMNWNNGKSLGINASSTQWVEISVLYL